LLLHYRESRALPLSPDTRVYGEFLTLEWLNHDGLYVLSEYVDRQEMAAEITGGSGICNCYVAWMAAFERGELLPYRIRYTDLQGARKLLDKRLPERVPEDWDCETECYRDVVIDWLEG
jgi:hypothetical protein